MTDTAKPVVLTYACRGKRVVPGRHQRVGCGFDLTSLITDLPTDGGTHQVRCPQCSNVVTVTRPTE